MTTGLADPLSQGYAVRVTDDERQALIESLVEEAIAGFDGVLTQQHVAVIRAQLEQELLFTEEGQRLIRQLSPDASVDASGNVAREGAESLPKNDKAVGDK